MDIKEIKELVEILENSTLSTLEVIDKDGNSVLLEKSSAPAQVAVTAPVRPFVTPVQAAPAAEAVQTDVASQAPSQMPTGHEGDPVDSPMVGVFYRKPSPDDEPYVEVGTQVKKGQTLCIIEAMKLMNEIPAEKDGVVTEICAKDGDLIEFGQTLFYIK